MLAERGRGIDRDDLDPLPPVLRALGKPVTDGGGVPAVDDAEDLSGGQVDQGRHPWLEPSPGTFIGAEPAHRPVAVLIDAQARHSHVLGGGEDHCGRRQRGLDQPPRDAMGPGDLGGSPARGEHRGDDLIPQPGRRTRTVRDLIGGFPERAPGAGRLEAEPAPLGPHHLHRPGHGDVAHLLGPAGVDLGREHPAGRTARRLDGFDHHSTASVGQVDRVCDAVIGQVEDRARSITLRTSILVHRLVVL